MVVKFFSNKKGGSSKAINYLLNEREQQGTARVLKGDPELTRQIINDIKFKQKTTVGCLSFEEKNISDDMKYQLMQDFENHLLPGMENRYNILWVEHTDKGRLELNFVIPKIELETQKSLNPYYHKADLPRVEKWQDLQNLKYNYSSPKDPSKQRTLQTDSKEVGLSKDYEQLDKLLHNLTEQGQINNREQLIELLKSNSIEVTRTGKDYLSIKLPESKKAKKFKGSIYDEQFTSTREIETISEKAEQRVREYNNRDTRAEQQKLARQLEIYTRQKEQKYRELYPTVRERTQNKNREIEREFNRDTQEQTPKYRGNDKRETGAREQSQSNINGSSNIHNNSSIDNRGSNVNIEQAVQQGRLNNLSYNKEVENDSTRTSINARTPTRESTKYRDYRETRKARTELYKSITETAESLREQSISNSRELHPTHRNTTRDIQQRIRIIENEHKQVIQQSESHLQQAGDIEHKSNGLTKLRQFGRKLTSYIETARSYIKDRYNDLKQRYDKNFVYKQEDLEKTFSAYDLRKDVLKKELSFNDINKVQKQFDISASRDIKQEQQAEQERQRSRSYSRGYSL
jgi:hypothetical protein